MRVFIFTQEEPFYLPLFFLKLLPLIEQDHIDVVGSGVLLPFNSQDSWFGVLRDNLLLYGPITFFNMGLRFAWRKAQDRMGIHRLTGRYLSVKRLLRKHGVPVVNIEQVNDPDFVHDLKEKFAVDLIISVACPQIFKQSALAASRFGGINFHAGYLPRYRGINPLFWSMLNQETETAISIHYLNAKIDDGAIIVQQETPILSDDTLDDMYKKVVRDGPALLVQAIRAIQNDTVEPLPNDPAKGSYFGFPGWREGRRFRRMGRRFI